MKLIVGLGNPGTKYAGTRHNVGFDVVDLLASRWGIDLAREKFHGWFGDGQGEGERVALLKPTTFMNRSGDAVLAAGRFYQLEKSDLLVILDDWALPLEHVRLRTRGSAGSHNGLQNVIDRVGFLDFARLRVGIGGPAGIPSQFVLTRFDAQERTQADRTIAMAADAACCWISEGPAAVMNRYNKKVEQE